MEPTNVQSRRVQWRMLTTGALVWAPFGGHSWRAATVIGLGKNRGDNTVVHLSFESGGKGRRVAGELFWRKAELKGRDKPKPPPAKSLALTTAAAGEMNSARGRIIDSTRKNAGTAFGIIGAPVPPGTFKQGRLFN